MDDTITYDLKIKHRNPVRTPDTYTGVRNLPVDETDIVNATTWKLTGDRVLIVIREGKTWVYNVDDLISWTASERVHVHID